MKNNLPFITIITPTYNRKELLEKAILSVLNQKKDIPYEWEMLIIDDWSNDWTKEYIQKYLDKYIDNIKYFYQENSWVWKARNAWINNINKNSDYLIFLDSDDELKIDLFSFFINKFNDFQIKWEYEKVLGFYFLCEDEKWNIIWNKKILNWNRKISFTYKNYLNWDINVEMWLITKSNIFINEPYLRFPEDIITETVMRSKMWQFMNKNWFKIFLYDYIWRLYNINHNWETKITKTISIDRFKKNAIWNKRVLEIIWDDLLKYWYKKSYSEYIFREWINWVLYWDKNKWISLIFKSLHYFLDIKKIVILLISILSRKLLLYIYKIYI